MHRGLRLGAMLMSGEGTLKVGHFERAVATADVLARTPLAGETVGAPAYMAPELFLADGMHSQASDLWAIGAVLAYLALGRPPFPADHLEALLSARMALLASSDGRLAGQAVAGMADWSPAFADLVGSLLAPSPAVRLAWPALLAHGFLSTQAGDDTLPSVAPPAWPGIAGRVCNAVAGLAPTVSVSRVMARVVANRANGVAEGESVVAVATDPEIEYDFGGEGVPWPPEDESHDALPDMPASPSARLRASVDLGDAAAQPSAGDHIRMASRDRPLSSSVVQILDGEIGEAGPSDASGSQPPLGSSVGPDAAGGGRPAVVMATPPLRPGLDGVVTVEAAALREGSPQPLWHSSDESVRPIVMNKKIEKVKKVVWDAKVLPFPVHTVDQVLAMAAAGDAALEAYLTTIYKAIIDEDLATPRRVRLCGGFFFF